MEKQDGRNAGRSASQFTWESERPQWYGAIDDLRRDLFRLTLAGGSGLAIGGLSTCLRCAPRQKA